MSKRDDGWQGRYRATDHTPLEDKTVDKWNRHFVAKDISNRNARDRMDAQTKTKAKTITVVVGGQKVKQRVQVKQIPAGYAEGVFFGRWVQFNKETLTHPKGGW